MRRLKTIPEVAVPPRQPGRRPLLRRGPCSASATARSPLLRRRGAWLVMLWALLLLQGACTSEAAPAPSPPPQIEALQERLVTAGIAVSRLEALRSLRELPECPAARFRWRIYLEGEGSFANVSLFDSSKLADACRSGFRAMALKGGEHAWERLRRDVAVEGPWMILFPPGQPAEATRQTIVRSLAGL